MKKIIKNTFMKSILLVSKISQEVNVNLDSGNIYTIIYNVSNTIVKIISKKLTKKQNVETKQLLSI